MMRFADVVTIERGEPVWRWYHVAEQAPQFAVGDHVGLDVVGQAWPLTAYVPFGVLTVCGQCTHVAAYENERAAGDDFTRRHARRCGYEPHTCEWTGCDRYTSGWFRDPDKFCSEHS